MNQLLERALTAVQRLPAEEQDEIARLMLSLAERENSPEDIDPAHAPDVTESLEQMRRGQYASETEIKSAFARFER